MLLRDIEPAARPWTIDANASRQPMTKPLFIIYFPIYLYLFLLSPSLSRSWPSKKRNYYHPEEGYAARLSRGLPIIFRE